MNTDRDHDVYAGWIVALVDGVWRKVHISPGFGTIAPFDEPNHHLGVFQLSDIERGQTKLTPIEHSSAALVGPEIVDKDVLDRIAIVRFGRIAQLYPKRRLDIIDNLFLLKIWYGNYDDLLGLDPWLERYPPPRRAR